MRRRESAKLFCQRTLSDASLAGSDAVSQKGSRMDLGVCVGDSLATNSQETESRPGPLGCRRRIDAPWKLSYRNMLREGTCQVLPAETDPPEGNYAESL